MPDDKNIVNPAEADAIAKAVAGAIAGAEAAAAEQEAQKENVVEIKKGMALEVLTPDNQLLFMGRVDAFVNGAVEIISSSGRDVPPVVFNTEVKLRGFLPGMKSVIYNGVVCGSSQYFWRIDKISGFRMEEHRAYFRQSVSVPAKLMCVNNIFDPTLPKSPNWITDCLVLNVSGGGALVQCSEEYNSGDWLLLMEAKLDEDNEPFSFTCRVRRVDKKPKYFIYGCQFEGLKQADQDRLIEAIFVIQRKEKQRKSEIKVIL